MKTYAQVSGIIVAGVFVLSLVANAVFAASTPVIGTAGSYAILSSTYTNTVPGTTINGDIGFTTAPAIVPAGTHLNYGSSAPYATAGIDQGSLLAGLNSQACTFTFAPGAIDLATDTTHGAIGVYTPGVYCTSGPGAASIGTAGITLSGSGTYIFRINGALTSVANSVITLSNNASACDVFWTPSSATTLAANSTFAGTNIDAAGITIGSNVNWVGRALAFGGTVTTGVDDTITAPNCAAPQTLNSLNVIKTVINDNGGTAVSSDFNIYIKLAGIDVVGSPATGVSLLGRNYSLLANTYVVSEDSSALYTTSFSGDCDANGNVIVGGAPKTCMITNNDIAVAIPPVPTQATLHIIKHVINDNGGVLSASSFSLRVRDNGSGMTDVSGSPAIGTESPGISYTLPAGTYTVSENANSAYVQSFSGDCNISGNIALSAGDDKTCIITNNDIPPPVVVPELPTIENLPDSIAVPISTVAPIPTSVPKLPNTGLFFEGKNTSNIYVLVTLLILGAGFIVTFKNLLK